MGVTGFLPASAPFSPDDRTQLDGVLARSRPVQRAWLAGFLAGLDAQQAPVEQEAPAPATAALSIVFVTESGNAEALAHKTAKLARRQGFRPEVIDFATMDVPALARAQNLIVIAATWGEGEPPARSVRTFAALMDGAANRLEGVRFGVLALGDTSYADFCAVGRQLDERLETLGGVRVIDRLDCDLDYEDPAAAWIEAALRQLKPAAAAQPAAVAGEASAALDAVAEIVEHVNLNSSRSQKQTIHLALSFDAGAPAYEPGDSLELFPENDPALVEEVLTATGQQGNAALRQALATERDITTLSALTVERYAQATGQAALAQRLKTGDLRAWLAGRQLVDLLAEFPATLTAPQLLDITRKLPPRAYSIASSRKEVGDEAHLLVAAVRYASHGRPRHGVASTFVADRLRKGERLRVRLKQNRRFRLPADPGADIIMVGPGTGVAPFRAFVQERRAVGATGRSWLFFGDQHFTHDFLYQLEWQEALEDGSLSRIDVAFSRDQPEKVYVQDRIRENRRDLVQWLENGAHLYVCGDAKAMAKDVRAAVVDAIADVKALPAPDAEQFVAALEQGGRYQQDVY